MRNPKQTASSAGTVTGTITRTVSPPASSKRSTLSTSSTSSAPTSATNSPSPSRATAVGTEPLVVLNQGLLDGTAAAAAHRFTDAGWTVQRIQENYVNDVVTTTAYYDPSVKGAFLAARALHRQFPTIHRVAQRFSNLPVGPVVVVLTSDYQP